VIGLSRPRGGEAKTPRGAARGRPLAVLLLQVLPYGVTVIVWETCVVPGVVSDVIAATD
jgi:hypothetical protein